MLRGGWNFDILSAFTNLAFLATPWYTRLMLQFTAIQVRINDLSSVSASAPAAGR